MRPREWLPNPPDGTPVAGGFDGSENNDWTAIRLETFDGFLFTPRWPGTDDPMIWNPERSGGRIPRHEVDDAWEILADRYVLSRVYCDPGFNKPSDPTSWISEIASWGTKFGDDVFVSWQMNGSLRTPAVYASLVRFETDLKSRRVTHDGCPITTAHIGNARKIPKPGDRYILGKPSPSAKIDAAVSTVLAHEAASDARAAGWDPTPVDRRVFVLRR